MSNRTDPKAKQVHGMNPQFLLETILRNKIYNTLYWKQSCFALNSETIIDKAIELKYIGGTYGVNKTPSEFICLVLKLLQIQPAEEIIEEYLSEDYAEYKYLRALAAFYVRLTDKSQSVYKKLEPLYNDYRKLRLRQSENEYSLTHMDEYIEDLLSKESVFDISLPKLTKRSTLELSGELEPRVSLLEADLDFGELDKENKSENEEEEFNLPISEGEESEEDKDDENINKNKDDNIPNHKKRRIEDNEEDTDDKLKKLDPNSAEYWMEMRKKIGLN